MDNAQIHKAKILKPLFECINVVYNSAYSPFLNLIEYVFGIVK